MELENLTACPVCQSSSFTPYLQVKDYTVSKDTFKIVRCQQCQFLFTNPRPFAQNLGSYYKSDDYISHTNQSHNPVHLVYKLARTQTLKWKYNLIKKFNPATLLDYGCGTGHFLNYCASKGMQASGFEPDAPARTIAAAKGVPVLPSTQQVNKQWDVITLWHVLEHIPDVNRVMDWLYKHITTHGKLIVALPNPESYDARHFKQYWAAYDVPRHLSHFTKKTFTLLAERHHFSVEQILPMKLDSFYVSLLSNRYKTNGFKPIKSFLTGLKSNSYANKTMNYSSLIYVLSPQHP